MVHMASWAGFDSMADSAELIACHPQRNGLDLIILINCGIRIVNICCPDLAHFAGQQVRRWAT